jgi:hypothetical protein
MNTHTKTLGILSIFCIAMAALEGAVVVYLRALYYPGEFTVAMKMIDVRILLVEISRELATLIMLWAISHLTGKNLKERFAYFLFTFAIWDIFYYIWLKVFIDWPSSLLDWDILFLIPFTWLGPVAAPVICSVTMIILALALLQPGNKMSRTSLALVLSGSCFILFTFLKDYGSLIIGNGFLPDFANLLRNEDFVALASTYIPQQYGWSLFWVGEAMIAVGIANVCFSQKKLSFGLYKTSDNL